MLAFVSILILIFLMLGVGKILWRTITMSDAERHQWRTGKRPDHADYDNDEL